MVEQCGLGDCSRRVIGTLSRGYRQRTGLADCLLHQADVLLLDEPLAGLDPAQVQTIRQLLKEWNRTRTVLFSTHVLSEAEQLCRRVLILNAGRLAAADSPERLVQAYGAKGFEEIFLRLTTLPPRVQNPDQRRRGP